MLRAAICLAAAWDGEGAFCKIRQVAEAMNLPRSYTPQVLGVLQKAALAEAKAGREGGYRLTRQPESISVLEVIEAAEGYLVSQRCPLRGGPCHWDEVCAMHPTWVRASEAIRETLAKTSLAEVSAVDRELLRGGLIASAPAGHRVLGHTHRPRSRTSRA